MMARFRPAGIEIVSGILAIAACGFWVMACLSTWGHVQTHSVAVEVGAAVAATVVAALLLGVAALLEREGDRQRLIAEYERREEALIRALSLQLGAVTSGPMPRLRSV